jgi:anti-anti-sigma factor
MAYSPEPYSAHLRTDAVLFVSGDLDDGAEQLLRQDLRTYSGDHALGLTVDLSGVTFFPSAAISVVASALKASERHGAELLLQAANASLAARVLHVCGLPYLAERP